MKNKKTIQALILIAVMLIGFLSEVMVVLAGDPVFMGGVMIAPSSPDKNPCPPNNPNKKPCGSRQISAPIAPQTLKLIKEHQRQQEEIRKYLEQRELIERRIIIDVLSHPEDWKYHSTQSIQREIERRTRKELQPPRIFKFPTSLKPLCCPMQDPIKKIEPSIRAPRFPAESVTDLRCKELGRRLTEVNFALRVAATAEEMMSDMEAVPTPEFQAPKTGWEVAKWLLKQLESIVEGKKWLAGKTDDELWDLHDNWCREARGKCPKEHKKYCKGWWPETFIKPPNRWPGG